MVVDAPRFNRPIKRPTASNAMRQKAALKKLSYCELWTGKTAEELRAEMQEQRARVLKRWGVK